MDKKRAGYYKFYVGQSWGEKEWYDLCISTSRLSSVEAVIPSLKTMMAELIHAMEGRQRSRPNCCYSR